MKKILVILMCTFAVHVQAQEGVAINNDGASPDASSILDLKSTTKGILIPRMTESQRTLISNVATGLLVYQTDGTSGFYFYNGSAWVSLSEDGAGWGVSGNAGTTNGTDFIGTTDAQDLDIRTNNVVRARITQKGQIETLNTGNSVFIGEGAGANDDLSDNKNVFVGKDAGAFNTTGYRNTANGYYALYSNTTGYHNTANGYLALYSNTTGTFNTANGYLALYSNTTGYKNNAIGSFALYSNTTGTLNTANGYGALYSNTTGYHNTALGSSADVASGNLTNATAIGYDAEVDASNKIQLGNTSVTSVETNGALTTGAVTYPNTDGTAGQVLTTDGAGVVSFQTPGSDQGNTLNEAYDEGGAGVGRQIDANDGAFRVNGDDGFIVTGTYNSGDAIEVSGAGTRMFFNPNKAAFRAGYIDGTQWDDANIGNYSTAMGYNTTASGSISTAMGSNTMASGLFSTAIGSMAIASGNYSTAMGTNATASEGYSTAMGTFTAASGVYSTALGTNTSASGSYSTAMGANTSAPSGFETAIGRYNTNYTPASTITWNSADRLFVIGNGTGSGAESNALIIYKNGTMNINDAYDMPTADGTAGQVMTTDGAGVVSFQSPSDNQDLSLSGNTLSLTNDATTVDLSGYMDNTDDWTNSGNNIYYDNGSVGIGTSSPNSKLHVNNSSTATGAHFRVQDAGNTKFCVANNGYTALYYNDAPSYNLQLNANSAAKPTSSVWTVSSDARLKTNVSPFSDGLNVLMAIDPVWFEYNGKAGMPTNERGVGTIAQELQKIAPYMVNEWTFTEGSLDEKTVRPDGPRTTTNYLGVDYGAMDFIVINSIQEQQRIIENQKAEIDELKAQMIEMQASIKTLTNKK